MSFRIPKLRSNAQALGAGFVLTLVMLGLSALFRFGFGLEATEATSRLAALTFGIRIHHGYIGIVMMIAAPFVKNVFLSRWLLGLGLALALSDLLHHGVLWLVIGTPDFDLFYPR